MTFEWFYIAWLVSLLMWVLVDQELFLDNATFTPEEDPTKKKKRMRNRRILVFLICPVIVIPWTGYWIISKYIKE